MSYIRNWYHVLVSKFRNRRRGTVRTMFSLLSIFTLLGAAVLTGTEASYVRLVANTSTVEAGQRFSIDIFASAHVPVNAVDITLRFDKNTVEVLEVDRGQSVLTIWTEDPIITGDTVILRGGTFRRGFIGEHKIATIDLMAKQTGQSEFRTEDVVLLAGDGRGTPVKLTESDTDRVSLFIYDENTVPENIGVDVKVIVLTDVDGDGTVTIKDISTFMSSWARQDTVYDFNSDGKMTFKDFSILLADFVFKT